MKNVFYTGSEAEWDQIDIGRNNRYLLEANIHFNATWHTPGEATETVTTPATCVADGEKTITVKCTSCGETLNETTETIPATGVHTPGASVETVLTNADCIHDGEKKITVKCSGCGETLSETTESIPATGQHTPGKPVTKTVKKATCVEKGEKTTTVSCTVCGEQLSKTTTTLDLTKHQDDDRDGICNICGAKVCKYCHEVHSSSFAGRLLKFVHSILYFFQHMLGLM